MIDPATWTWISVATVDLQQLHLGTEVHLVVLSGSSWASLMAPANTDAVIGYVDDFNLSCTY